MFTLEWKSGREKWLDDLYASHLESKTPKQLVPTKFDVIPSIATEKEVIVETTVYDGPAPGSANNAWSIFPPEHTADSEWTYIIDFDRDAFTIDGLAHYRLSNMAENWLDHIDLDDDGRRCMPKSLDSIHLAYDVFVSPPPVDKDLITIYNERCPSIVEAPTSSNPLKSAMLVRLQGTFHNCCRVPFMETWKEWGPTDIRMQKLLYTLVKLSTWESITWDPKTTASQGIWIEPHADSLLQTATFPRESEYYIRIGDRRILISLATHLEMENVLKMAVAKVVQLSDVDVIQVACILSLQHVVIVTVDKTTSSVKVTHTKPLELFGDKSEGGKALIVTLSPIIPHLDNVPRNGNLPIELIEHIFEFLAHSPGGIKTIPTFAQACKMFAAIVVDRTIHLNGRTLLNFPTWLPGCFYGVDDEGFIGMYNFGEAKYPVPWKSDNTKIYTAMVDGVEIGLGISQFSLTPVDVVEHLRNVHQRAIGDLSGYPGIEDLSDSEYEYDSE